MNDRMVVGEWRITEINKWKYVSFVMIDIQIGYVGIRAVIFCFSFFGIEIEIQVIFDCWSLEESIVFMV